MATHSSILAWRASWTQELVGYSPWGRKELDTTEQLTLHLMEALKGLQIQIVSSGVEYTTICLVGVLKV